MSAGSAGERGGGNVGGGIGAQCGHRRRARRRGWFSTPVDAAGGRRPQRHPGRIRLGPSDAGGQFPRRLEPQFDVGARRWRFPLGGERRRVAQWRRWRAGRWRRRSRRRRWPSLNGSCELVSHGPSNRNQGLTHEDRSPWSLVSRVVLMLAVAVPLAAAATPRSKHSRRRTRRSTHWRRRSKPMTTQRLLAIFGDEHKDACRRSRSRGGKREPCAKILAAMQTLRVLNEPSPDRRVLVIGDQAWPLPIPLVRTGDRWRFATDEGIEEIINRRIGGNERNAIYVLRAYVDAQRDVRVARSRRRRRAAVRAEARQLAGQARRPVLAGRCGEGRRGEPVRAADRRERGRTSRATRQAIRIAATTSGS